MSWRWIRGEGCGDALEAPAEQASRRRRRHRRENTLGLAPGLNANLRLLIITFIKYKSISVTSSSFFFMTKRVELRVPC